MLRFPTTLTAILVKGDGKCCIAELELELDVIDTNPRNPSNATMNFNFFKPLTRESYESVEEAVMMAAIEGYVQDGHIPVIFLTSILHDCPKPTRLYPIDSTHSKAILEKYVQTIDVNRGF